MVRPLLAVDDAARLQAAENRLLRLNDDRPEEVLGVSGRLRQAQLGQPPDVLPQRRPLLVLLPDVRPLERRHHEVLGLHEDVLRRPDVRFHQARSYAPKGFAQRTSARFVSGLE